MDGDPLENGAFVVDQNHFVDAGPASQLLEKYPGEFVDLGECIVLPGLITWITVLFAAAFCRLETFPNGLAESMR
jgi:hypothetical protein